MIYLPDEVKSSNCAYVYDKDTIRVFTHKPTNTDIDYYYTDYFINSHYISRVGSTRFSGYYNNYPECMNYNNFTTDFYYRNDFASILFIFVIFAFFIIKVPLKIILRLFKRFL